MKVRMFKVSDMDYINLDMVAWVDVVKYNRVSEQIRIEFSGAKEPELYHYTDDLWNRLLKAMGVDEQ